MANTASALKRVRQTATRTARNRKIKFNVRTLRKAAFAAIESGDEAAIKEASAKYVSAIDRAGKSGLLHRNTVARIKSRFAAKVAAAKG